MKKLLPLLLLLVLVSCSKNEYVNVIPKDAKFVLSVDMKSIAEKADFAHSQYYDQIVSVLKGSAGNSADQVQNYIDDPAQMGIDFRQPVYFFQTADMYGVAMAVYDKGDLESLIENMKKEGVCGDIEESDGLSFVQSPLGASIAFDKKSLLVLVPAGSATQQYSQEFCKQLFSQDEENRFVESEAFSEFEDLDGELAFYGDFGALPQDVVGDFKSLLPDGIRYSDVQIFSSVKTDSGKAVWSSFLKGKSKDIQKLFEKDENRFKHIDGEFIESPMQDFSIWACFGVEKGALLNMLKQSDTGKQVLLMIERAIDIEAILRQVEGDVAIVLPQDAASSGTTTDFLLLAEVDDDDFMKEVDYWQQSMKDYGMSMSKTIGNNYLINTGDFSINWGIDDDNIYFATPDMFAKNSVTPRTDLLVANKKDIEDSYFYVYVNVPAMVKADKAKATRNLSVADNALEDISSIIIQSKSHESLDITVNLTDASQQFLKAMLQ